MLARKASPCFPGQRQSYVAQHQLCLGGGPCPGHGKSSDLETGCTPQPWQGGEPLAVTWAKDPYPQDIYRVFNHDYDGIVYAGELPHAS